MPGTCPICGKSNGRNKKACSHECYAKLRQHTKTCAVCGAEFEAPPSSDKITCSRACSTENRKRMQATGIYGESIERMHEAIPNSPLTGRFETHMHAKSWIIQAPDGQIYECRNLINWLREHEDLLDGTVKQAFDGICKIKYTMQGRRPRTKSKSWKGWTLINYGE